MKKRAGLRGDRPGFTILEILIASLIMAVVVIGALSMYTKSSRTSADQQQYVRVQQDVRAALYFLSRDVRMAGAGMTPDAFGTALEGTDNQNQGGPVQPDRLKLMGNIDDPFNLPVQSCGGNATQITLVDHSLEQYPYPDSYYVGKTVLLIPRPSSGCTNAILRQITAVIHNPGGTNEKFQFGGGVGVNPPGGTKPPCPDSNYDGGSVILSQVREYWLDTTGNASGLTAGVGGYIGGGTAGVLYQTTNGVHYPIAQNIENLQFRYNGDFDGDVNGTLDGFQDWSPAWTEAQIGRIRQVRIWILGRTPARFAGVSGPSAGGTYLYRRPAMANSPAATSDDWHKRFLLESTSAIRNLSLDIYNK